MKTNDDLINILEKIIYNKKEEYTSIRSIEIMNVDSNGKAEIKVTKKAEKLISHLLSDVDLILMKSDFIDSYEVKYKSDMVVIFSIKFKENKLHY